MMSLRILRGMVKFIGSIQTARNMSFQSNLMPKQSGDRQRLEGYLSCPQRLALAVA
jgi:hypothetical protein